MQQKLSHRMIQSLKLLQDTNIQLEQRIQSELSENPLLEQTDVGGEELSRDVEDSAETGTAETAELDLSEEGLMSPDAFEDGFAYTYDRSSGESDGDYQEKKDYVQSLQTYDEDLEAHLLHQLRDRKISENQRLLVEFLAGSLDENGYLKIPPEEIQSITGVTSQEVDGAVDILHSLDPPGIGARSLQECLLLQIDRKKNLHPLARTIVADYWEYFEKQKTMPLSRLLEVDSRDTARAMEDIKKLDPKPGKQFFGGAGDDQVIIPDIIVKKRGRGWVSIINDVFIPDLKINEAYSDSIRDRKDEKAVKKFLREKHNSANWLMEAIQQRKRTMLKVMDAIIEHQYAFFEKGDESRLRPLTLREIADKTDLHPSTVSRVSNNKYVETPYGIFEIKYFFNSSMGGDGDVAGVQIKNRIKDLIENESAQKPLSDQKISDILKEDGYTVARRTVAKYRDQLGIPTARMRKRYD
jgi:RNA polymerase sigma-54 factor